MRWTACVWTNFTKHPEFLMMLYIIYVHCPRFIVDTKVSIPINVISSLYFVIAFSWPFWIPRSLILWNYIWAAQSCVSQSMMMDHNSAIVYVCQTVCFFHETLVGIWPRPAPRIVGEIQHLLRTYIVWRITYNRHILRILQAPTLMDKYSCWTATRLWWYFKDFIRRSYSDLSSSSIW